MPDIMITTADTAKLAPAKTARQPVQPLAALLREVLKADRQDTRDQAAWEAEEHRVRKMYPECPTGIENAGADRRAAQSAEAWIEDAIADGHIKKSSPVVREFREWKAACQAIDDQHLDRSLERQWHDSNKRLEQLDARFRRAPAKSLADIRAKLDYILHYECFTDERSRGLIRAMKRDVPAREAVCW
jgi:hypothetical protein